MGLSYKVLKVYPSSKEAELDNIPKEDLFTKYKVYGPLDCKKYENVSFAIPEYQTEHFNIANDTMNTLFPDYPTFKGINYILLDLTQDPEDLNQEYKKLIVDVAYKRLL